MNDSKIFIIAGLVTLGLLVGIIVLATKLGNAATVPPSTEAKAITTTNSYDWGKIGINNGLAEAQFEIQNQGSGPLKLFNITTSCACTTAQLTTPKATSPIFDMHSRSTYVAELAPQEKAQLKVVFDPLFHGPNSLGPISRQVTIQTNDPNQKSLSFSLTADVVK